MRASRGARRTGSCPKGSVRTLVVVEALPVRELGIEVDVARVGQELIELLLVHSVAANGLAVDEAVDLILCDP